MTPITLQNTIPGSDLLSHFERVLQRTLQTTSDTITDRLMQEIHVVACHTSILEQRVDELDVITTNYEEEIGTLREENSSLRTRLEDFENRARKSNLRVQGIP